MKQKLPLPSVLRAVFGDGARKSFRTEELRVGDIYGILYRPTGPGRRWPAVILSHGYAGSTANCTPYAGRFAARGFACYVFDFHGGGPASRSPGQMTEMSVLTEAADLDAVLSRVRELECVDASRVFLWGESQGGFVSAYVAARRPEDVRGLILFYPAFVLQDGIRARYPNPADIPETAFVMGNWIGAVYARDALSFDIYEVMRGYRGDVLIVHGDADALVPLSYSERARDAYASAELRVIPGTPHGFRDAIDAPASMALDFLKAHS
ncbi:MAG: alpha/beta fold hydrolase [Oscillibacter sp.]|nr:alpha/beta fold hydrolase [Oscillibacter sp.]